MKITNFALVFAFSAALATAETFTGIITDSMCVASHKAMNISPDAECVRQCVKADPNVRYVLFDGQRTYKLSDQETPSAFAGQRVSISGDLYKSGVIKVNKIAPAKK
jgi:hypothetical protein